MLQPQATKQLCVRSHNDGRGAHRDRAHAHREINPPANEKTSGDGNGEQQGTEAFIDLLR